ncbi:MAG: ester cyclase [Agrobacterium cavarae]|uniref:ester cyclase n=1 Tax=Agrobacterium cavarae TaxID=2528239 RepID=UPI0028AE08D2|nr:ester cyclase [Agrobacterium cavarae]
MTQLADHYRAYIACLNDQRWDDLGTFVASDVTHNGRSFGLDGYRSMLINDFETIPDLSFKIELLACDPPFIAARLEFDCAPKSMFLGLPINGRRISFAENVFYEFRDLRIVSVWSVIDKTAIEAQLGLKEDVRSP